MTLRQRHDIMRLRMLSRSCGASKHLFAVDAGTKWALGDGDRRWGGPPNKAALTGKAGKSGGVCNDAQPDNRLRHYRRPGVCGILRTAGAGGRDRRYRRTESAGANVADRAGGVLRAKRKLPARQALGVRPLWPPLLVRSLLRRG